MEKISGVALAAIEMHLIAPQRFLHDVRWIGDQSVAIHGDPSAGADKARAAFSPNRFSRIRFAVDDHATFVAVTGAAVLNPDFHRPGPVGVRGPLNDVVMMLAPVQFPNIKWVRTGVAIERYHRRGAQV